MMKKQASQNKLRNVGLNINLVIVYSINCLEKVLSVVLCMGLGQMKTHTHTNTSFLTTIFIEPTFY